MFKFCNSLILVFWCYLSLISQANIYHVNFKKDAAYVGVGIGLNVLSTVLRNNVDEVTMADVNLLDASSISGFDRSAVHNYSSNAKDVSDVLLYTAATLPLFSYFSKSCRNEGLSVGIMALETFLLTNGITNSTKNLSQRFRPYTYNPEVPIDEKLNVNSRLSFFSGHASTTAAMLFFSAKVFLDLHPEMEHKYIIWTSVALLPAAISYLRYEAGRHFPTDLITGYLVGASIGYLIPTMHLSKDIKLNILGGQGLNIQALF